MEQRWYRRFLCSACAKKKPASINLTCSALKALNTSFYLAQYDDYPDNIIGGNNAQDNRYLYAKATAYATAADFKTAMSGVQLCYELATPIEITLTAQEIDTLLGTNNIWADAGPVDVEYRADTKLYIQKINAPTDDDMTADAQIASGKYFIIGNTLYLSTTVIPAGDTIIPGTNCQKTNLAAALNALNT